jgi:hypothetical protein
LLALSRMVVAAPVAARPGLLPLPLIDPRKSAARCVGERRQPVNPSASRALISARARMRRKNGQSKSGKCKIVRCEAVRDRQIGQHKMVRIGSMLCAIGQQKWSSTRPTEYKGDRVRAVEDRASQDRAVQTNPPQHRRWGVLGSRWERHWRRRCFGRELKDWAVRRASGWPDNEGDIQGAHVVAAWRRRPKVRTLWDSFRGGATKLKAHCEGEACAWKESWRGLRQAPVQPEGERERVREEVTLPLVPVG